MARVKGLVKWFSNQKGYGFVNPETGEDVFVHHTDISGDGFKTLAEGEQVEFEIVDSPKGLRAQEVIRLDTSHSGGASGPS